MSLSCHVGACSSAPKVARRATTMALADRRPSRAVPEQVVGGVTVPIPSGKHGVARTRGGGSSTTVVSLQCRHHPVVPLPSPGGSGFYECQITGLHVREKVTKDGIVRLIPRSCMSHHVQMPRDTFSYPVERSWQPLRAHIGWTAVSTGRTQPSHRLLDAHMPFLTRTIESRYSKVKY